MIDMCQNINILYLQLNNKELSTKGTSNIGAGVNHNYENHKIFFLTRMLF